MVCNSTTISLRESSSLNINQAYIPFSRVLQTAIYLCLYGIIHKEPGPDIVFSYHSYFFNQIVLAELDK